MICALMCVVAPVSYYRRHIDVKGSIHVIQSYLFAANVSDFTTFAAQKNRYWVFASIFLQRYVLNLCSNGDRDTDTRQEKTQHERGDVVKRCQICSVSHVIFA